MIALLRPVVPWATQITTCFLPICAGNYPWADEPASNNSGSSCNGASGQGAGPSSEGGGANGNLAAQRHYAQRYRTLVAQRDRTREEQGILGTEVVRTFNWMEEREAAVQERLGEMQAASGGGTSWAQRLAAGKAALLEQQLKRVQGIHAQARKLLSD